MLAGMSGESYSLFQTILGACAIVWRDAMIVLIKLPSNAPRETRRHVLADFTDAKEASPPPAIAATIEKIECAISGAPTDFSGAPIDQSGFADFQSRIYRITQSIASGSTLTYGEVAARAGDPGAAQAVGQCLGANPFPVVIPCHRVIGADGKMIGFSASGGVETKKKLLEIEGAFALDKLPLFGGAPN